MSIHPIFAKAAVSAAVWIALGLVGVAQPASAQSYTQEQQQLCSGDAFRLCGPEIPDVDRVTACMVRQRALLSPGCRAVFRYEGAVEVVPVREPRPMKKPMKASTKARKPMKAKQTSDR